jgi:hypothetical protein
VLSTELGSLEQQIVARAWLLQCHHTIHASTVVCHGPTRTSTSAAAGGGLGRDYRTGSYVSRSPPPRRSGPDRSRHSTRAQARRVGSEPDRRRGHRTSTEWKAEDPKSIDVEAEHSQEEEEEEEEEAVAADEDKEDEEEEDEVEEEDEDLQVEEEESMILSQDAVDVLQVKLREMQSRSGWTVASEDDKPDENEHKEKENEAKALHPPESAVVIDQPDPAPTPNTTTNNRHRQKLERMAELARLWPADEDDDME